MNSDKAIVHSAQPEADSNALRGRVAEKPPPHEWICSHSAALAQSRARQLHASSRKRRLYADYRELLALESQGRKLNLLGPGNVRSAQAEQRSQSPVRSFDFLNVHAAATAPGVEAFPPPVFSTADPRLLLVVDQRLNMFFGTRRNLKSVVAAHAAALIAWRVLAHQHRLGAIVFNDRKMVQLSPGCSRLHTILLLQTVLDQNHRLLPDSGIHSNPRMLNDALRRIQKGSNGNSRIFLVTDASGCDEDTLQLLTTISEQNDLFIILVYDPQQARFCSPDGFFSDQSISRREIRKAVRILREKNQSAIWRQQSLTGRFFPDSIPVIPLNTRDNVVVQLRRAFARAALSHFFRSRSAPSVFPSNNEDPTLGRASPAASPPKPFGGAGNCTSNQKQPIEKHYEK